MWPHPAADKVVARQAPACVFRHTLKYIFHIIAGRWEHFKWRFLGLILWNCSLSGPWPENSWQNDYQMWERRKADSLSVFVNMDICREKPTQTLTQYSRQQAIHTKKPNQLPLVQLSVCVLVAKGPWGDLATAQHITLLSWPQHMALGTQHSLTAACVVVECVQSQGIVLQNMHKV